MNSTFFNRKSGFQNRKSGFLNRKSGFFHENLTWCWQRLRPERFGGGVTLAALQRDRSDTIPVCVRGPGRCDRSSATSGPWASEPPTSCTCNQREVYQSPACIYKADSILTRTSHHRRLQPAAGPPCQTLHGRVATRRVRWSTAHVVQRRLAVGGDRAGRPLRGSARPPVARVETE